MQSLVVERMLQLVVPHYPITAILVGCGGTGSYVAYALARIAASTNRDLHIIFIDGDRVESKNVGRQLFSMADVGRNKAEVLAARLNAAQGLRIASISEFYTPSMYQSLTRHDRYPIIIGAVDTVDARLAIHTSIQMHTTMWIDAGNTEWGGQVYAGNGVPMRTSFLGESIATTVPWPSVQDSALITLPSLADAQPQQLACAEAMETNAQGLMVNQMMGAIVSQYLYQIIVERKLTMMSTTMNLRLPTMRSQPITRSALEPFFKN